MMIIADYLVQYRSLVMSFNELIIVAVAYSWLPSDNCPFPVQHAPVLNSQRCILKALSWPSSMPWHFGCDYTFVCSVIYSHYMCMFSWIGCVVLCGQLKKWNNCTPPS